MDHLSKQQLVLLALLVSFVTSLMTGIVTVSLMDQAPQNVTRTITQVIQKTVASAVSTGATSTAAVSIAVNDQVADATAAITPSIVRLRDGDRGDVTGLGLVVSRSGAVMADKNILDQLNVPQVIFGNGGSVPVTLTRFEISGNIAFLAPVRPIMETKPITFGDPARLGETVWSLTGTSTYILSQGIVTELDTTGSSTLPLIHTSIPSPHLLAGAPLFNATGAVVGIASGSQTGAGDAIFYPVFNARDAIPR